MASGQVTVTNPNHHNDLVAGLWSLLRDKRGVDVEVGCGGRYVVAHRLVLDAFHLSHCKLSATQRQLRTDDCRTLEALVEFAYTGQVTISGQELYFLLAMARAVDFRLLVDALQEVVQNHDETTVKMEPDIEICEVYREPIPKSLVTACKGNDGRSTENSDFRQAGSHSRSSEVPVKERHLSHMDSVKIEPCPDVEIVSQEPIPESRLMFREREIFERLVTEPTRCNDFQQAGDQSSISEVLVKEEHESQSDFEEGIIGQAFLQPAHTIEMNPVRRSIYQIEEAALVDHHFSTPDNTALLPRRYDPQEILDRDRHDALHCWISQSQVGRSKDRLVAPQSMEIETKQQSRTVDHRKSLIVNRPQESTAARLSPVVDLDVVVTSTSRSARKRTADRQTSFLAPKEHRCNECRRSFTSRSSLIGHIHVMGDETPKVERAEPKPS